MRNLHPIKLVVGFGRKAERNGISGADLAARQYDSHNAGLSREIALRIPAKQGGRKAVLIGIQLPTRISKAGHLHHGMCAELKSRTSRERKQVDPPGGDVLTNVTGSKWKSRDTKFLMQLFVDEMHLAKIGRGRVSPYQRSVFDRRSQMRVVFDTKPFNQTNAILHRLGEGMGLASADRNDQAWTSGDFHLLLDRTSFHEPQQAWSRMPVLCFGKPRQLTLPSRQPASLLANCEATGQGRHSASPRPITHFRSSPERKSISSVNIVTACR